MTALYIVATPIGNLNDITFRAIEALKEADFILCEDTRQTLKLLNRYNISKPLVSYFQHSKLAKVDYIIEQLRRGRNVALVTDAGTPGISDPGGKLIGKVIESSSSRVKIVPIPGPSALIAAASISGFPMDKFLFLGFPPAKKKRKKFFEEIVGSKHSVIFYESSHRILKTLKEIDSFVGNQEMVVCRELTKQFESIYRGRAGEIIKTLEDDKNNLKGEFVIVVNNE